MSSLSVAFTCVNARLRRRSRRWRAGPRQSGHGDAARRGVSLLCFFCCNNYKFFISLFIVRPSGPARRRPRLCVAHSSTTRPSARPVHPLVVMFTVGFTCYLNVLSVFVSLVLRGGPPHLQGHDGRQRHRRPREGHPTQTQITKTRKHQTTTNAPSEEFSTPTAE